MARWRDVKKGKVDKNINEPKKTQEETIENSCASPTDRIKAFITDMFMIMMPIMYITTYVILSGKDDFQGSEIARWLTMGIYGLVVILFWIKKGQTPGFKAYDLKLIDDKTKKIPTFTLALFRYIMFLISAISIVGAMLPFFRKDKKTLQDLVTNTSVIKDPS